MLRKDVFIIMADCQDGSYTCSVYDSPRVALDAVNKRGVNDKQFQTIEEMCQWMDDDPYERGYYSAGTIRYEIKDGQLFLPESFHFNLG